jgi:hypothetical protein
LEGRFSTRHLNFTKQSKLVSDFLCKMEKSIKSGEVINKDHIVLATTNRRNG